MAKTFEINLKVATYEAIDINNQRIVIHHQNLSTSNTQVKSLIFTIQHIKSSGHGSALSKRYLWGITKSCKEGSFGCDETSAGNRFSKKKD